MAAALMAGGSSVLLASTTPAPSGIGAAPPPAGRVSPTTLRRIDPVALQAMVEKTARELLVPGAFVLLRTPQGEFTATYGTTALGTASPPGVATHFRIASNTKTMTAAVVLLLAREGKLALDDPVSKFVPRVPGGDEITIEQLSSMRSGLYNYTDAPELWASLDRDPAKVWSEGELLDIAFARSPAFPPGTDYQYNNTNYALLGLIVEKVEGRPLAEVMRDRLFVPLGMRHTALPARADDTLPDPYARGYGYGGTSVVLSDASPYPPEVQSAARAGTLPPIDYTGLNPSFASAAGGVVSTAGDLAVWIRALVGGGVLDAATRRRWLDALRPEDPGAPDGQRYGYGIAELRWGPNELYFHGGETPGYNSKIAHDPTNDLTLVVWTNLAVSLDGQQPANTLMVNVLDQVYQVSPLSRAPTRPVASAAGVRATRRGSFTSTRDVRCVHARSCFAFEEVPFA